MPSLLHAGLLFVHVTGAIVWLGGMVFALFALRPAAVQVLAPPERLPLMAAALGRFFRLVAVAAITLLATGAALLAPAGEAVPLGWGLMASAGVLMAAVFVFIVAVPYRALCRGVAARQWPPAAAALDRVRVLVTVNAVLGFAAVAAALAARF